MNRWLIDSDILIEGERGNPVFEKWRTSPGEFATADIIRGEFLIGVHMVSQPAKRLRGEQFYRDKIAMLPAFANEAGDYEIGARMAGEARRQGKGNPSLVDGLLGAMALRIGAKVATRNVKDFIAMGVPCENPLAEEHPATTAPA